MKPMNAQDIEKMIASGIPGSKVVVEDTHGDGHHYAAKVEARCFATLSRVQQHQMVYQALQGKIGEAIHALQLETRVAGEDKNA